MTHGGLTGMLNTMGPIANLLFLNVGQCKRHTIYIYTTEAKFLEQNVTNFRYQYQDVSV